MDFFAELQKLVFAKPRNTLQGRFVHNSPYGDYLTQTKNAYICYFGSELQDCYYSDYMYKCNDCVDCIGLANCELCYECVDCSDLYSCAYLQDCHNSSNCAFGIDLLNCQDCFGCFGLRNGQYYIFNKKYTEETYREKLAAFQQQSSEKILQELLPYTNQHPRLYARQLKGEENCYGDYIYYSKNCYMCYNIRNSSNCAYIYDGVETKTPIADSYDCSYCGGVQTCYSCNNTLYATDCNFLLNCNTVNESEYCLDCYNCQNCFGCVYLENKQYYILNRSFSRDDYVMTLKQLKSLLKEQGIYGKTWDRILVDS